MAARWGLVLFGVALPSIASAGTGCLSDAEIELALGEQVRSGAFDGALPVLPAQLDSADPVPNGSTPQRDFWPDEVWPD